MLRRPPRRWRRTGAWALVEASGLFDADWYRRAYPDVALSGIDPMWHYATRGADQGRDPNPLFRTTWYRTTYPDVAESGMNPLVHYLASGAAEGRDPGPGFDTQWYLAANPDIRDDILNPLGHFLVHGRAEGRRPRPPSRPAPSRANVVLVSGEPGSPGHRYRVEDLAAAVRALGGRATVLTVPEAASTHRGKVDGADLLVLWRTSWGPEVEAVVTRAREVGAVVAFDVDDLMVDPALAVEALVDGIRSQRLTEEEVAHWFGLMRRTAEAADVRICTTPALADRLRAIAAPVHVLPNGFDEATWERSRLAARLVATRPDDGLVRLGYAAGSRTHQRDFAVCAEAVATVLREQPHCRLVAFRDGLVLDEFPAFDDLHEQVEWRDLVPLSRLPFELARFDVNLAPLEVGNPFCESKSALKMYEAALVGVPTVASPTEPFRDAIRDGYDGFLPADGDTWAGVLRDLVAEPRRRRDTGAAAHRAVRWRCGPERRVLAVQSLLEQVLDDGPIAAAAFARELDRPSAPEPAVPVAHEVRAFDRLRTARVTVVVPVHDYATYLEEALDSVAAQTLRDLDLVVVDDASTDDSRAVAASWLERHAERFGRAVLLGIDDNVGVAGARNAGFDAAETVTVLPLDADNLLGPGCAARLLEALDGSAAVFAYPRIRHIGEDSALLSVGDVRGYLPYAPQTLVGSNYIDALALVRTAAWQAAGGYRAVLFGWEDYDLWCRFAEMGLGGVQVPEDLALYRIHDDSMLHRSTHAGDHLETVRAAITQAHPWLRLEDAPLHGGPEVDAHDSKGPAAVATVAAPARVPAPGRGLPARPPPPEDAGGTGRRRHPSGRDQGTLNERARELLPLLRCPVTGEALVESPDGGLRSADSGHPWPVVAGRPVLFPGATPVVHPDGHVGNPLPERALALSAQTDGRILHLSGGGTAVGAARAVEVDAAVYATTDVVGDAHRLPFVGEAFDLVIAMNAFEHYRDPRAVVDELQRVLRPGGCVFVHTAFLQPVHEAPHHYYNCTRYGLEEWFRDFETLDLLVSDNFEPAYALSWLAAEAQDLLAAEASPTAAAEFASATVDEVARFWRDPGDRGHARWAGFAELAPESRERLAAGFEYIGRRRE